MAENVTRAGRQAKRGLLRCHSLILFILLWLVGLALGGTTRAQAPEYGIVPMYGVPMACCGTCVPGDAEAATADYEE